MKKWALLTALVLGFTSASAFAHDEHHDGYTESRHDRVDWHISHLNRMLAHVRWELTRYRGDWRLRREVERVSREVSRVNWRARHGYEGWRLRREVESLHNQLHRIEEQLHVRRGDWYRWQ
ncbi:MAG: hypothetical protein QOG48_264 [Verrucomicrobiota bacterium]|jgi:hypothetical protein